MFVIPKSGLSFRDPHTLMRVPPDGMEVPDGSLEWARIIADGDATVGEPPAESPADPIAEPPLEPPVTAPQAPTGKGKAQAGPAASEEG